MGKERRSLEKERDDVGAFREGKEESWRGNELPPCRCLEQIEIQPSRRQAGRQSLQLKI